MFISSVLIKTDVTCVKLKENFVFAGIGNFVHIFNKNTKDLLLKIKVFDGQKIYGLELSTCLKKLLVYGANNLKVFKCDLSLPLLTEICYTEAKDWILAAKWIDRNKFIVTVSMHNNVTLWCSDLQLVKVIECKQKCILYCACLVYDTWTNLTVLCGTVFSEVLIWFPAKCCDKQISSVEHRLIGHKGVLFSIDYNENTGIICSTSDDRSAILWSTANRELYESNLNINKKCVIFGHSARVFRCKVLNRFIVTGGEDSLVNVWDLDGKLIKKIEGQGDCVWSLDCDEDRNLLVIGGGDSSVTIYPIKTELEECLLVQEEKRVPRKVGLLQSNNLVMLTEDGGLYYYCFGGKCWTCIEKLDDLRKYALMELSKCRNLLSLAGYYGNIYLYQEVNNTLVMLKKCILPYTTKIYSFHWLNCKTFVVCAEEGILSLWYYKTKELHLISLNQLPSSTERWSTAASFVSKSTYVVGDRKGNLYLFNINVIDPIQTIKKAHNYLGITNLTFTENAVYSLGRNSIIKSYHSKGNELITTSCDKLPFCWLARLLEKRYVLGFSGNNFILWDYKNRRTLLEVNCHGGHRSWDFNKQLNEIKFVYIKDKAVRLTSCNWNCLNPKDLVEGFHVYEINALKAVKYATDSYILLSGGEDTTLKLAFTDLKGQFEIIHNLKSHLSSIRAIVISLIKKENNSENYVAFSAGGRAQIIMWDIKITKERKIFCQEKYSYYETIARETSEVRIMDMCMKTTKDEVLLFVACSDGNIKIFTANMEANSELIFVANVFYQLKCITKISTLQFKENFLLVTLATDGNVNFWDFTEYGNCKDFNELKQLELLRPMYTLSCHQSGINCFACYESSNNYLLLTGGDDSVIKLNLIELVNGKIPTINNRATYVDTTTHCAQITGAFISKEYFLTTSVDQKVVLFKWKLIENELECSEVNRYNSSIADIQGMDCIEETTYFTVIIYGKGLETLIISKYECN